MSDELIEKLALKNKLNEETIEKLIKSILDFTHSVCFSSHDYVIPLRAMASDFQAIKVYYDKVLDSIKE